MFWLVEVDFPWWW